MGLACGPKVIKYLFFIFNFVFFILGIAVLGVGIYSRVQSDSFSNFFAGDILPTAGNLLIAAGVIVALIGFMGCYGAIKESKWPVITYTLCVVLVVILEIAGGIYAYTKKEEVEAVVTKQIAKSLEEYGNSDMAAQGLSKAIDLFQEKVECCGSASPADWFNTQYIKTARNGTAENGSYVVVPKSCCRKGDDDDHDDDHDDGDDDGDCNKFDNTGTKKGYYEIGCKDKSIEFIKDNLVLVGGIGVGIAVVQFIGIGFAVCLIRSFREKSGTTV